MGINDIAEKTIHEEMADMIFAGRAILADG